MLGVIELLCIYYFVADNPFFTIMLLLDSCVLFINEKLHIVNFSTLWILSPQSASIINVFLYQAYQIHITLCICTIYTSDYIRTSEAGFLIG